jgi:hypothetical protein
MQVSTIGSDLAKHVFQVHGIGANEKVVVDRLAAALNVNTADRQGMLNAALAMLDGQRPKDEIEAALIVQMAAAHAVAMDFLARTKRARDVDSVEVCGKVANRLLRAYTMQCAELTSLRRGGKHVVEVRHVHVYRDRRKPEGTPAKKQPLPRGPNGRFAAAPVSREPIAA